MTLEQILPINADTLDGHSLDDLVDMFSAMIDTGNRVTATRPPDERHDLTGKQPCTVKSVSADQVFVQLDADAPGIITPAEMGAPASPEERGNCLTNPLGAFVWIGGGGSEADAVGPVQVAPWTTYVPVTDDTLAKIGTGTLKGAYTQIQTTVHFSIDLLYGAPAALPGTTVPTFRLPVLPVARRFNFAGTFSTSPAGAEFDVIFRTAGDGSTRTLFTYVNSDGTAFLSSKLPFTDTRPGLYARGAGSRVAINGTYEAAS